MRAAGRTLLLLLLPLAACFSDRPRPSPTGPGTTPRLHVELLAPLHNSVAVAGQAVQVVVAASDLEGSRLTGLGFVAYRLQGGERIDSAAHALAAPTAAARDTFVFMLPAHYPTNTQVDITGIAFGGGGASQTTVPRSIVVIRPATPQRAAGAGMESAR